MTGADRHRNNVLAFAVLFALILFGSGPLQAGPPKETGQTSDRQPAREPAIVQEIERIVRNIKVSSAGEGEMEPLDLLEGPLLQHERPGMFVRGTVWAWGKPGRPQALLSLSLTGRASDPQWCHEMVSLSTMPVQATTRDKTWWSTRSAGWNPKPISDAPETAETPDGRLLQMKNMAGRFTGFVYRTSQDRRKISLHGEPILRYGPSGGTVDGGIFVFVANVMNPEILLVIEAEKDPQGAAIWKYNVSPLSSDGLTLKCDDKEVWNRPVINWLSTKPSDTYRIYVPSAKEEIYLRELEGRE